MRTIRVTRSMKISAERAFDMMADHAGYTAFPGVKSAKVTKPGTTEPNGLGAVREVALSGAWVEEVITEFERPRRLGYKIIRSKPPIEHAGGLIELTPTADGVDVVWTSTFRVKIPVIGWLLTRIAARQMTGLFTRGLAIGEERALAQQARAG
jgi:hypothetical protein